ncbi:CDP-glycerol glycerophosphotransferase family protein [Jeotgalibacillus proteolyticus]|uniref:CDP-glycerol glycerophosphotransferase family protein n=1 Tax=Jeotgalibacillus proteolyticus TaxID=2082395 RepID=UPI003CFB83B2
MIDWLKSLYLLFFKLIFVVCNVMPAARKITFYVTFKQNAQFIIHELLELNDDMRIVLVCNRHSVETFKNLSDDRVKIISLESRKSFIRRIYHLASSKIIVVDNYFPFLAVTKFKRNVECIQVWHAAGAIKSFGLEDEGTLLRSKAAVKRFQKVYDRFDKIVIGSEEMASVFKKAFNVKDKVFLKTGIPRTDLFYQQFEKERIRSSFFNQFKQARQKKIVLYAPTFRDYSSHSHLLDFSFLGNELGDDYLFIIKLHPVTKQELIIPDHLKNLFLRIDAGYDVNELLQITDILITDYSSIPFEFCLLKKPMIFFAYDLDKYIKERGIWNNYHKLVPGPVVETNQALVKAIKEEKIYNPEFYHSFCERWNRYSTGSSSKNLVDYILSKL